MNFKLTNLTHEYKGKSTDGKPYPPEFPIENFDKYKEVDTGTTYYFNEEIQDWKISKEGEGGGGSSVVVEPLTATENKTYTAPSGKAYSPVEVNVPNPSTGEIEIIENGTYDVTEKASAVVNVPIPEPELESKTVTVTENGTTTIIPSEGNDGLSEVELTVNVPSEEPVINALSVTGNGTYTAPSGVDGFNPVVVNVSVEGLTIDDIAMKTISEAIGTSATEVKPIAFNAYTNLTTASFPACTSIGTSAFNACTELRTASFPTCTYIGASAFYMCRELRTVSFPTCTYIGASAFSACGKLTTASFPACTSIGTNAFYMCDNITTASFPVCTSIGGSAFRSCTSLTEMTVGTECSSVCFLANSNVFSYCSALTSIYVPASLLTAYQSATNWTYFSSKLVGV